MKVTVIGCGNAFSNYNFNQSFVIEEYGRKMLIDCGMQTPNALALAKIKATEINDIYISHSHADHIGGLEYFAFTRYDWSHRPTKWDDVYGYKDAIKNVKVIDYAPRLIANEQLLKDLWNKSLSGGLESMEGFVATIETFFEPVPIAPNKKFDWQGWTVELIQQIHIMSGSYIMPSFGIMFSREGHKSIYFVTDSQHCSPKQMEVFYKKADIIIQDCECSGVNFQFDEGNNVYKDQKGKYNIWPKDDMEILDLMANGAKPETWECFKFGSGVHANYAQLAGYNSANSIKLPIEIKNKMWLSHYQDFVIDGKDMYGNTVAWEEKAKEDGFAGFLDVGQVFEL
jgi:ribonuclease BN (tRNA processing enzyme)